MPIKIGDIVCFKTISSYLYGYVVTKPFKEKDRTSHICMVHWFHINHESWEYVKELKKVTHV